MTRRRRDREVVGPDGPRVLGRVAPAAGAAALAALTLCTSAAAALATPSESAPAEAVALPGGNARIGSVHGMPDERPAFATRVAPFVLDRTPVTVAAFAAFVEKKGYETDAERLGRSAVMTFGTGEWKLVEGASWRRPFGPTGPEAEPDHPVTQVTWRDAAAYCAWAGKRLPTEIEWEYAARAGHAGEPAYAFGDRLVREGRYLANVWTGTFPILNDAADGYRTTSPVGRFGTTPVGLTDMAGNVWQWTADWYRPYAERGDPLPAGFTGEKVIRGGSFLCERKVCHGFRVSARGHTAPDSSSMHVGFRCAASDESGRRATPSRDGVAASTGPEPQCPPIGAAKASSAATHVAATVSASDIPVAHTPPGGYGADFPEPVLATCTEPLVEGAPDLRGLWRTVRAVQAEESSSRLLSVVRFLFWKALGVERARKPVPAGHRIHSYVERIEQCGDRVVDIGGGTIADARADSTRENGVHDVSAFDFETPIHVVASYEDGAFMLRPARIPWIEITRRLDSDGNLVWHRPDLGDLVVTLERIGGPCDKPPGTEWVR